jgi:hypothetical protein
MARPRKPALADEQTITIGTDGANTVFGATGVFAPGEEVFAQISSNPGPGNPDTEGEGFGLNNTADTSGTVSFHVPTDALVPDRPRTVTAKFWNEGETTTASGTFPFA